MTVATDIAQSGPFFPNGVTTAFAFEVDAATGDDLTVVWQSASGAVEIIPPASYSVQIAPNEPGGTVTFTAPPVVPSAGASLWIVLDPAFRQPDRFADEGPFNQSLVEGSLDRLARLSIALKNATDRSIKAEFGKVAPALRIGDAAASGDILQYNAEDGALDLIPVQDSAIAELERQAAASAALAQALTGPMFLSVLAGLAGTTDGDEFGVDEGDGTATIYLNNAGSAVLRRVIIIAPIANGSAGQIGTASGQTIQEVLDELKAEVQLAGAALSRSAIKALAPTAGARVRLVEAGRGGTFICRAGSAPASDPLEGRYIVSNTEGFFWEREWEGGLVLPEWFGGAIDRGDIDSAAAMQACINLFGKLTIRKGIYYGTAGLNGNGAVIEGEGPLMSGYICSSATAHLLSNRGVGAEAGTASFAVGGDFRGFGLARSVLPAQTASVALDRTQGHGLSFDMVSNQIVEDVYTYDNLVEVYLARSLSPKLINLRGLRTAAFANAADRWYGFCAYGDPTGMGAPWASGPSGNPSALFNIGKFSSAPHANAKAYYLQRHLQDLWLTGKHEAAGAGIQFDIDPEGQPCSDAYIENAVADGCLTHGIRARNMPLGSNYKIKKAWVAPRAGATGAGVLADGAHGLEVEVTGDFSFAPALDGVAASNASLMQIKAELKNCQRPVNATQINSSKVYAEGFCDLDGAAAGQLISGSSVSDCTLEAAGLATGTKKWDVAIDIDATSEGCLIDVVKVKRGSGNAVASGRRVRIGTSLVTTQGDVSGHVIINPGAGAML